MSGGMPGPYRFENFLLDPADRRLSRDGVPVEINARYLDALALLVREQGRLVSKDRFLEEVWSGVPVTDEALTQCIKTLRRQLGDTATSPRFIETVPKHGYRFIAAVEAGKAASTPPDAVPALAPTPAEPGRFTWRHFVLLGGAGTIGGGMCGLLGGLFYGFAGASQPLQPGMGAVSVLLVLVCLGIVAASIGGGAIGFGIAASGFAARRFGPWTVAGGAAGGLVVGALAKMLGLDAFNLLLGRTPGDITGGLEGGLLGAAIGLGAWLGARGADSPPLRRTMIFAGLFGAAAGALVPLLGGRMFSGSLDLLARSFPGSRLRLDQIGALFGEPAFGPISQVACGALEGLLLGACIVGAHILARREIWGEG
jgi:DNA-binding winged helix-turn-helix (wHTH) protein